MITKRPSQNRGSTKLDWLESYHTFSFGDYYDPQQMNFGPLRVINDDIIAPGKGFLPHPHRDMEIVTYVLEGTLKHKDSLGNGSIIRPGEVQRMSAGTGITHSEFNHSNSESVHLLQIWLLPKRTGIFPGYEQKYFSLDDKLNELVLVASPFGASPAGQENSVTFIKM